MVKCTLPTVITRKLPTPEADDPRGVCRAQVDVAECGGLCSYYAEQGGLMVGYEDGKTE